MTPRNKRRALFYLSNGWPKHLVAVKLKCSWDSIYREARDIDPEFKAAMEAAMDVPREIVERRLFLDAKKSGYDRAQQIFLKGNWRDKYGDKLELSSSNLELLIQQSYEAPVDPSNGSSDDKNKNS